MIGFGLLFFFFCYFLKEFRSHHENWWHHNIISGKRKLREENHRLDCQQIGLIKQFSHSLCKHRVKQTAIRTWECKYGARWCFIKINASFTGLRFTPVHTPRSLWARTLACVRQCCHLLRNLTNIVLTVQHFDLISEALSLSLGFDLCSAYSWSEEGVFSIIRESYEQVFKL